MEQSLLVSTALAVIGLAFGSFAGASVWRLRARQLTHDTAHGEKVTVSEKKQVAKLQKRTLLEDRSVCLHCGRVLKWYDLLPLVSWLSTKGRCRYCHTRIGAMEPIIELGVALFFVISYVFWPVSLDTWIAITQLVIWLIAGVGLAILFAYDARWYLLPNVITFPLIGLGIVNAGLFIAISPQPGLATLSVIGSCLFLSGLYYLIYVVSRHQWVGFGDVKLGLALGLLLADWQIAVLALFLANLLGTLLFLPLMATGKVERGTHIPFGPLLIAGWALAGIFGQSILDWYFSISLGLV